MNVLTFPSFTNPLKDTGHFKEEYFNFLSMNTQEQQLFFSNDGHLVPTRENSELVGGSSLSTEQYTARYAYNGTTDNHMANTAGEYKNLTMNLLSTRTDILSMTPMPNRIEQYSDENHNLYSNVNASVNQLPVNTTASLGVLNFSIDGSGNLFATINGVTKQVTLT